MDDRDAQEDRPVDVLTDLLRAPSDRASSGGAAPDRGAVDRGAPSRPRPGDRPPPAPRPPVLVVRAIAGAGLSVFGVALGIVSLSWVDAAPERVAAVSEQAAAPVTPTPSAPPPVVPTPAPVAVVPPPAPSPTPTAAPRPARVPVTVLNNSRRTRLAARGAERFRAGGWPVAAVGNFRGRIPVTTVYYDPGLEAAAREFAATFDGIARVRPRFATLPARGVVVVLTREFAA